MPPYCELTRISWWQAAAGKAHVRVVYIAPMESLAKERAAEWRERLGRGLGLEVFELTGEAQTDLDLVKRGNIIVSTPERWDVISRRWKIASRKPVQQVALFIVDELHLVGGANGPVIEVSHSSRIPTTHVVFQACAWR